MEQVVKEISHLFEFFPKEVAPLEYPSQSEVNDAEGIFRLKFFPLKIYLKFISMSQ